MGKTKMSLINLKKLLASVMLVLLLTSEVFATQGFRPWAPYQRDQFGGGARRTEGVYGTLEGVYYTFAPVKNIVVGNPTFEEQSYREVYNGAGFVRQTNTITANHISSISGLGTRAEIGNNRGHHGWSIGGYSLMGMSTSMEMPDVSMIIDDSAAAIAVFTITEPDVLYHNVWAGGSTWDNIANTNFWGGITSHNFPIPNNPYGPTALWGWFSTTLGGVDSGRLAPLPINFDYARVTTKVDHWVIDALYTYRFHPCRFGNLDFIGGVRYMEIDDSLLFLGEGSLWQGVDVDPNTGDLTGSATGFGSILGDSDWRFKAENHIIAPQIGGRWSRTSNRWTLTAEGRFMAGFNQQNLRSQGTYGSHFNNVDTSILGATPQAVLDQGVYPWLPLGLYPAGARSFNYSKTHQAFSPGVEVKINANWQLTNAVGFTFGVTGMWVDEIARGSKINNYSISNTGQFFGLNGSGFTDSALMYGVNFGVTVNRH